MERNLRAACLALRADEAAGLVRDFLLVVWLLLLACGRELIFEICGVESVGWFLLRSVGAHDSQELLLYGITSCLLKSVSTTIECDEFMCFEVMMLYEHVATRVGEDSR